MTRSQSQIKSQYQLSKMSLQKGSEEDDASNPILNDSHELEYIKEELEEEEHMLENELDRKMGSDPERDFELKIKKRRFIKLKMERKLLK